MSTEVHELLPLPSNFLDGLRKAFATTPRFNEGDLPSRTEQGPINAAGAGAAERAREEGAVELPPVNGGVQAWTFIFCAFVLECLVWGFPYAYGVFQEWYLSSPDSPFLGESEAAINAIGTITLGIQYMEGLLVLFATQRFPQWTKTFMASGLVICTMALVVSSFATKVWHLILLQGIVYGVAGGILYMPVLNWLSEWFIQRRAFAASLIFGGTGLGGATFPLMANFLLQRVGFRWTLRILASLVGVLGGLALLGTKPRLPAARRGTLAPLSFHFISKPLFIFMAITTFVQSLAYFPVSLYVPSYAASLGYSRLNGTLALTAFNLANVVGQITFGFYCDRGPYTAGMIFSSLCAAFVAFVLWGFAHSLALLYVFAVVFGGLSGGFTSFWAPAAAELYAEQSSSPFLCFSIVRGIAAVCGPFIAAALHPTPVGVAVDSSASGWAGYGFTGMIIFVGSMMLATTGLSIVCVTVRPKVSHISQQST